MVVNDNLSFFMLKVLCYIVNILGINVYWYKVREEFKVIVSSKGVLIFFFIFLLVDMYWFELYDLIGRNYEDIFNEERR